MRPARISLRTRLVVAFTGVALVVLVLSGLATFGLVRRSLQQRALADMRGRSADLAALVQSNDFAGSPGAEVAHRAARRRHAGRAHHARRHGRRPPQLPTAAAVAAGRHPARGAARQPGGQRPAGQHGVPRHPDRNARSPEPARRRRDRSGRPHGAAQRVPAHAARGPHRVARRRVALDLAVAAADPPDPHHRTRRRATGDGRPLGPRRRPRRDRRRARRRSPPR